MGIVEPSIANNTAGNWEVNEDLHFVLPKQIIRTICLKRRCDLLITRLVVSSGDDSELSPYLMTCPSQMSPENSR
jgi:hypothetical protein